MTETTALDRSHAQMQANTEDDAPRLRFFERLADSELFLMLTEEARDENISPELFDVADGRFVLAFDREERLGRFAGRPVPYAALSGRVLAGMLAGQGIGLGLNLEVAPSSMLIPSEALAWLADTLNHAPHEAEGHLEEFLPPVGLPEMLLTSLDTKLATAVGLASSAYLTGTRTKGGGFGHLLAFVDAVPGAEGALAKAVSEALLFSGVEAGVLDVSFFASSDPVAASLAKVGLRFDIPRPDRSSAAMTAPGQNPDRPPILK
ncbi:MAG: SseB family protein [Ruegeria sp.]